MIELEDTICALASPPGHGGKSVVRLSGPHLRRTIAQLDITDLGPEGASASDDATAAEGVTANTLRAKRVLVELGAPFGRLPMEMLNWPRNAGYTGQPAAEFHFMGAPPLAQHFLERLQGAGARMAMPGEFTMRAFFAGRLDLTQAEAVLGVINADDDRGLRTALDQLTGGLSQPLEQFRQELINLLADLEAGLDFVDEDIEFIDSATLATRLKVLSELISSMAERMRSRGRSTDAPLIGLWGPANVGKSCLLNRLAGRQAAIVANFIGTTRDPVEVRLRRPGARELRFVDTAGIVELSSSHAGNTLGDVHAQAQQLGQAMIAAADITLWCHDWTVGNVFETPELPTPVLAQSATLRVATKSDLMSDEAKERLQHTGWLVVSGETGEGVEQLVLAIESALEERSRQDIVATTAARCEETLRDAAHGLAAAAEVAGSGQGHEIVAAEMRLAIDAVGRVTGTVYTDDILDAVFSRFCIGK